MSDPDQLPVLFFMTNDNIDIITASLITSPWLIKCSIVQFLADSMVGSDKGKIKAIVQGPLI